MIEPKRPATAGELTKVERSVLLYLETCAVDQGGKVEDARMNDEDMDAIMPWMLSEFITFKALSEPRDARGRSGRYTHYVELSNDAWRVAGEARKSRSTGNRYPG